MHMHTKVQGQESTLHLCPYIPSHSLSATHTQTTKERQSHTHSFCHAHTHTAKERQCLTHSLSLPNTHTQQKRGSLSHTLSATHTHTGKAQPTADFTGANCTLEAKGRHDPCVVPRAIPIMETMVALVLADMCLMQEARKNTVPVPIQRALCPSSLLLWLCVCGARGTRAFGSLRFHSDGMTCGVKDIPTDVLVGKRSLSENVCV